jgi:hypothetical protein
VNHGVYPHEHSSPSEQQNLRSGVRAPLALWGWSVVLYGVLLWLCWPSLRFLPISLQDQARIEALAPLGLFQALFSTSGGPLRPVDNLFFG